eukprot:6171937-Pleurochrysis_carterae.AAC.3
MSCACQKGVSHTASTLPRRHKANCTVDSERSLNCRLVLRRNVPVSSSIAAFSLRKSTAILNHPYLYLS